MARKTESFPELAWQSWMLGFEAGCVMWLRGMRMMAGGKLAEREAERMVREKLVANAMLLPTLMMGGLDQSSEEMGARVLAHYRKPVRANRRRLSRKA